MYNVYSLSESFYMYNAIEDEHRFIGNRKDFIHFLAGGFRCIYAPLDKIGCFEECDPTIRNIYFDNYTCNLNEINNPNINRYYVFYDGYGRTIDLFDFKHEVYEEYCRLIELHKKMRSVTEKEYIGRYRKDPVSNISKRDKGKYRRSLRHPKLNTVRRMVLNPEYSSFNKRKDKNIIYYWTDDFFRNYEKNWKRQRKTQYKVS